MQNGQIGISPLANVELLIRLKEQEPGIEGQLCPLNRK